MTAAFYQNETKFYVAVDCIILGFDQKELNVLLYKRKFEPMMGQWSLMDGFIKAGESIEEAASRVLTDCTGIDNLFMEQVGAYGDITRDLGERVISVAYYSLVNMNDFSSETLEEYNAVWAKVSEVPQLIFDHNQMITDTLARLRRKAATRPVGFNLLPEKFTLPQLQNLYEAIYQTQLDKRNFRKKLNAMDILEKLDEKDKKGSKRGAIICSTKKNTTICWNKGSISPYNKKHHSTCRLWQMCRIFRSQSSPSGTDLRIRCFHIRSRSTLNICQNRRHTADYRIRFCKRIPVKS